MSFLYITEEGAHITKKGGKFIVGRNLETVFEVPEEIVEGVVLVESVQVSSQAMVEFLKKGIPVTWISSTGKFFGRLESTSHSHVFRQKAQVMALDSDFSLEVSRKIILAKVHNQITVLRRYNRELALPEIEQAVQNIKALRKHIFLVDEKSQIMGYEGMIARLYFSALGRMVPEQFCFSKRTRQPPRDAFNAMLSFGYTLLMYEIYTDICNQGLHPYFGFLHALKNHHPALASDLMEEWRAVIVDSMVLSLVRHHEINIEHFQKNDDGEGIFLTRDGRNIFLREYEKKLRTMNKYMDMEKKVSFRESLAKQVERFAQALMADDAALYRPLFLR